MSYHNVTNFARSCVIQPRHPKTKLPTSAVEREELAPKYKNKFTRPTVDKQTNNHRTAIVNMKDSIRKTTSEEMLSPCVKLNKASLLRLAKLKANQPPIFPTTKHYNSEEDLTVSPREDSPPELSVLINDDEQFFEHLQYLKSENKKTLKRLEKMYNNSSLVGRSRNTTLQSDNETFSFHNKRDAHQVSRQAWTKEAYVHDSSSEDEFDQQLKVKVPETHVNILPDESDNTSDFRGRSSSYDVIASMWEDFSIDDYAPYVKQPKKDKNEWSPSITIPEPFKMTIRDEARSKRKSKRIEQIEYEKLEKQLKEEAELHKKIVPTPVPPTTFLPLYEELQEHREGKRQYVKALSKEILMASQKPFKFSKREEAKKELKRSKSMSNIYKQQKEEDKRKHLFKANPYPDKLFDLTLADQIAEQEEYRKIKIKLRSEEMLASASLPMSMKTRGDMRQYYPTGDRTRRAKDELRERKSRTFKPTVNQDVPDFENLQKKFELELARRKNVNTPTVCEPFNLHTANVSRRRSQFLESVEASKTDLLPPSGRAAHRRSHSLERILDKTDGSWRASSPAVSLNETARLRQERLRQSLEKSKLDDLRQSVENFKKAKQENELKKKIAAKSAVHDVARGRSKETKEKLASFKQADHARMKEYNNYLREIDNRLDDRQFLFERESQTNAKRKAQRRYEEILQEAGVEQSMVETIRKGSTDGVVRTSLDPQTGATVSSDEDGDSYDDSNEEKSSIDEQQSNGYDKRNSLDDSDATTSGEERTNGGDGDVISDDGSYTPIANKTHSVEEYSDDEI